MVIVVFHIEPPKDGNEVEKVRLNPSLKTYDERSEGIRVVLEELRRKNVFFTLKGWRNEVGGEGIFRPHIW